MKTNAFIAILLILSVGMNAQQWSVSEKERARHMDRVRIFYEWEYKAELIKERETGNLWLKLMTPAGPQVSEFGQVCPRELKT